MFQLSNVTPSPPLLSLIKFKYRKYYVGHIFERVILEFEFNCSVFKIMIHHLKASFINLLHNT